MVNILRLGATKTRQCVLGHDSNSVDPLSKTLVRTVFQTGASETEGDSVSAVVSAILLKWNHSQYTRPLSIPLLEITAG